jgi:hypothetical protein
MPSIEIPDITIREIYIPDVPEIYSPHYITITEPPDIDVAGCTYQHRDIKNTGNRNLLLEDPNGVFTTCDFPFPSFIPLDYSPDNLVIVEELPASSPTPDMPESKQPAIPDIPKEKDIELPLCPGKSDQRVGDFRNEKRVERVIGHKRGEDGVECITLYENVPFKDQYIPEVSTIVSTAVIGLVAASTPLLLNVVKPLVKQIVKKLTKKKDKLE